MSNLLGYQSAERAATLAIAAGEHLLLSGPPGTAKSLFARKIFARYEGEFFQRTLTRFTDESALFGLPNLRVMRELGEIEYPARGLASATFAFLDEIFDASDVLLRSLLTLLNERIWDRSRDIIHVPLRTCIASANYTRSNEVLSAVTDRFLFYLQPMPLTDAERLHLWNGERYEEIEQHAEKISIEQLDATAARAAEVAISPATAQALCAWCGHHNFSPRRERKFARVLRIAAAQRGGSTVEEQDFDCAAWVLPLEEQDRQAPISELKDSLKKVLREQEQLALLSSIEAERVDLMKLDRLVKRAKLLKVLLAKLPSSPVSDDVEHRKSALKRELQSNHNSALAELGVL